MITFSEIRKGTLYRRLDIHEFVLKNRDIIPNLSTKEIYQKAIRENVQFKNKVNTKNIINDLQNMETLKKYLQRNGFKRKRGRPKKHGITL